MQNGEHGAAERGGDGIGPAALASGRTGASQARCRNLADAVPVGGPRAEALRLSEVRNEAILDSVADAILTINEAGVLLGFNRAAEAMFGVPSEELLWRPLDRLIPLADLREEGGVRLEFASGQTTALVARDRAAEAERADGTRFPVELSVSVSEVAGRRLYTAILRDVSGRRRVEAELLAAKEAAEAADRARSIFVATMSHELRTPLNAVIGFSQLLEARAGQVGGEGQTQGDERLRSCVGAIRQAGERLLAIIDDILDMARVDTGGLSLTDGAVDPSVLAERAVADLRFHSTRQGVTVEVVACRRSAATSGAWVRRWATCCPTPSSSVPQGLP
ncbi:histidine kinase dimerization/phospho-acceptor domain-containing protein [Azospirillum endophyticum]|uniref:histidine kinase dimerization/phospho-acceptor domain-containing protein n=1 Tax=Azospirillum endophyticum TaxID=2800326 RepID=UPI0020000AB1|nr:histidine kinase dimerization/phospho-acceptor domain-containing protein [Azospirillum endophyticum]